VAANARGIPREQGDARHGRVCANKEIRQHIGLAATQPAIATKSVNREEQRCLGDLKHSEIQGFHGSIKRLNFLELA
jgi:hypothetical protein